MPTWRLCFTDDPEIAGNYAIKTTYPPDPGEKENVIIYSQADFTIPPDPTKGYWTTVGYDTMIKAEWLDDPKEINEQQ